MAAPPAAYRPAVRICASGTALPARNALSTVSEWRFARTANRRAACAKPRARKGPARAGGAPAARVAPLWEGDPVTSDVRIRRVLAVAALLAGFGMALPRFLTHGPYPRLGAVTTDGVVQRVLGPPARGILKPGDQLLTLNGLAL